MQLLANCSYEDGETEGLGLIPSKVERINNSEVQELKISHGF